METKMVLNKCMAAFVAVAVGWIGTHGSAAQEQSAKPARLNKVISLFQQGEVAFGSFVPAGDIEAAIAARRSGWDFAIFERYIDLAICR